MQNNQQLNEGLRSEDLSEMILSTLEIDTYKSKMGEDRDVCVVSFKAKDRSPAKDLMEFIEKGYNFVLDADVSSGENKDGEYFVFVELNRTEKLAEQIQELIYGIKKLTNIESFKFRYYKSGRENDLTEEAVKSVVPSNPIAYEQAMNGFKVEGYKHFFNKTLMDDLSLKGDLITFHKPFDKKFTFKIIEDQESISMNEGTITVDEESTSEVFWLTKVLGDYNINKIGENFLFTNGDKTILLQRTE
jgi:flavodoxin